ncbi:MAG TPA: hypothetical protein VIT91_13565 [Chthoniobacterales bacterium]
MFETIVGYFWSVVLVYAIAGFLFGVPFVSFWSRRLDPAAHGGSWGFRLTILPGVVALWPLLFVKTLRSKSARQTPPDTEGFCSAGALRRMHGAAFLAIVVLVPVICGAALLIRPNEKQSVVAQLSPAAFAESVPLASSRPDNLPVEVTLRTDGRHFQVQLDIARPLEEPVVALYWSAGHLPDGVPSDAVFLGSVWGPTRLAFSLPDEAGKTPGVLTFIALVGEQRVVGTLPLNRR